MKLIIRRFLILLLFVFSFYYTNKVVDLLKENDPLMQEIKNTDEKYRIDAIDAIIIDSTISSGKRGKEIDYQKTYSNMKEYGAYNESLTVQKDVIPTISIDNYYDKYIISGNQKSKKVALVFVGLEDNKLKKIIKILDNNHVIGTFFIDGNIIEKNVSYLKKKHEHEFELLSYQGGYKESFFKTSISYLESITGKNSKYCFTEEENEKLLKLCKKLKLHTVKPSLMIHKNLFLEVKEGLNNAIIISLNNSLKFEKELSLTVSYIKEKGYQIVSLEKLLSE